MTEEQLDALLTVLEDIAKSLRKLAGRHAETSDRS